jgi:lipoyl(octanoyl) transferase
MWLGAGVDYRHAWDLQRHIAAERAAGVAPDTLLLLEHAPVYTAGPRAPMEHVVGELGAPLVQTDRGGQVTYHGPGQLVGYPIIDLAAKGLGPRAYVRGLEAALAEALAEFGAAAHTEDGLTGVWTARGKIAAIGVKISRGVSLHGFALNVTTNLAAYAPIVPCGILDRPVTTMTQVLRDVGAMAVPGMSEVRGSVALAIGRQLGINWSQVPATEALSWMTGNPGESAVIFVEC